MTREDFYAKYGDVKVKFLSYYKFVFSYSAHLPDGKLLTCNYGACCDEIYKHEVDAGAEETVGSLQPYAGSVYENGKEIEGFYDY